MDNSFLHSKKLLLVDDEPELLKMVSAILADEGFVIKCCICIFRNNDFIAPFKCRLYSCIYAKIGLQANNH